MSKKDQNLKQQIRELEEVVAWFEQDDLDVEQAITMFEKGSKLAEEISTQLAHLENKITVLKERFDAAS